MESGLGLDLGLDLGFDPGFFDRYLWWCCCCTCWSCWSWVSDEEEKNDERKRRKRQGIWNGVLGQSESGDHLPSLLDLDRPESQVLVWLEIRVSVVPVAHGCAGIPLP